VVREPVGFAVSLSTDTAPLVGVRMTEEFQAEIKHWPKKQSDHPLPDQDRIEDKKMIHV
jgi:hypothetical protein